MKSVKLSEMQWEAVLGCLKAVLRIEDLPELRTALFAGSLMSGKEVAVLRDRVQTAEQMIQSAIEQPEPERTR